MKTISSQLKLSTLTAEQSSGTLYGQKKRINRKIQNRKRKTTHLIHTFCVATKNDDGTVELTYHQSSLTVRGQNPEQSKKTAMRMSQKHSNKITAEYQITMDQKESQKINKQITNPIPLNYWPNQTYFMPMVQFSYII